MEAAEIRRNSRLALARMRFYRFCQLLDPKFYQPHRDYLRSVCDTMQDFIEGPKTVLIINMPPRHGKSFTMSHFVEWLLGRDQTKKVVMGSYNETLSTRFSKTVRNAISEIKADASRTVYSDIFPGVRIKDGLDQLIGRTILVERRESLIEVRPVVEDRASEVGQKIQDLAHRLANVPHLFAGKGDKIRIFQRLRAADFFFGKVFTARRRYDQRAVRREDRAFHKEREISIGRQQRALPEYISVYNGKLRHDAMQFGGL